MESRSIPCSGGGLALGMNSEIPFAVNLSNLGGTTLIPTVARRAIGPYTRQVMSERAKEVVVIGAGKIGMRSGLWGQW